MAKLIRNSLKTPDGTVLTSNSRHDYVTHKDTLTGKIYMVDGGLSYERRSCNGDEVDLSLYDDQSHNVQRAVLTWGSYGKNGDEPLKRIAIRDMETEHIQAVLNECNPSAVFKNCMEEELKQRGMK
jgi:hypothetical protein